MPIVTLPDGSQKTFEAPLTIMQLAESIGPGLAKACIAGKIDGVLVDAADLIENLTAHRAGRTNLDVGNRQELAGRSKAFVDVVCGRIHEILQKNQGFEIERPHPSDRTLKQVIRDRRL